MTPAEKFMEEKEQIRAGRMERILISAFELFSTNGIDNIAITDIAKKAEIGVASIYRYFNTKEEIAIQTGIWAWKRQKEIIGPTLQGKDYDAATGLEQVERICKMFITLYDTQKDFLRFVNFFDQYIVRVNIEKTRLFEYEKTISTVQQIVEAAIKKGIEDKTISNSFKGSEDVLYFTLMHTLFNTTQKLCLNGDILQMDEMVAGKTELEVLTGILIKGIKSNNGLA